MEYIVWFEGIKTGMDSLVGGKGQHLGELFNLKLPVPPGFAITTKAFDKYLEVAKIKDKIEEIIKNTDVDNTDQLMNASTQIKELIVSQEIPPYIKGEVIDAYKNLSFSTEVLTPRAMEMISMGREFALVAVRSSATAEDLPTASFAGQQATFLNVKGLKDYIEAVKKCWASLFEPRAIFYRAKQGFTSASISVLIQRMVNADKAGVMFTKEPTTGEDKLIIESTWGLGESLVSGQVQPDTYVVSPDGKIIEKTIGKKERMKTRDLATDKMVDLPVAAEKVNKQVLTEDEIYSLVQYGLKIEKHYQKPQDIEFAIEKGRIYIVQTRAVTTIGKKIEEKETHGQVLVKGMGSSPGVGTGTVVIVKTMEDLSKIQKGNVLVTRMTSPDMVVAMSRSEAIVTSEGGLTCHASIVGREMGLPVIVGTQNATEVLKEGQLVTVDAFKGVVYAGEIEVEKPEEHVEIKEIKEEISTATSIKVNLAFPTKLETVSKQTDGVGLLRIEHTITQRGIHPAKLIREGKEEEYIKILLDCIRPIAQAFNPKPVWVRTLDARSDEFRNLQGGADEPQEDNPMLGWHGIRRSLDEPGILKAEFKAIKQLHEEGLTNVWVMLPFIISVNELRKTKQIAREVGLPNTVYMGIMIETPAAAMSIEDFCKEGIKFASFGSNDLTQLALGIDRNNAKIAPLFSERHTAMKKMFKYAIKVCKSYHVESSICGEGPSNDMELVEFLVRTGIDSLSVNIDAIQKVRKKVFEIERKILLDLARRR